MVYIAVKGDTWDSISYKAFNDEFQFPIILENNRNMSDVVVFEGGESVIIPDQIVEEDTIISSPWQTGTKIAIITPAWR